MMLRRPTAPHPSGKLPKQPGHAFPVACMVGAALVLLPVTPAMAHSTATSCTHGSVGWFHEQHFVTASWRDGRHIHLVQLTHPFDSSPSYDGISCSS